MIVDGKTVDISAEVDLDDSKVKDMDAVVDRFVVAASMRKPSRRGSPRRCW